MKVLIAGGSGLVGSKLTQMLVEEGHDVRHLSRKKYAHPEAEVYKWNLDHLEIEVGALEGVDAVVNLAGAGVADSRWTAKRKQILYSSRIEAVKCLNKHIQESDNKPKVVITASGKDYYGELPFKEISKEDDLAGDSFLARLCKDWEAEARVLDQHGLRTAQLRIGMVLDKESGALPKLAQPINLGVGAPLGSGDQIIPWIHIQDICRMIIHIIEKPDASGPFNTVSHNALTNKAFTKAVAKKLKRPLILPNVPSFVMRLMLGEMASIVLTGNDASNQKIIDTGFEFNYKHLENALDDIYG